jgi:hypothetical protein
MKSLDELRRIIPKQCTEPEQGIINVAVDLTENLFENIELIAKELEQIVIMNARIAVALEKIASRHA